MVTYYKETHAHANQWVHVASSSACRYLKKGYSIELWSFLPCKNRWNRSSSENQRITNSRMLWCTRLCLQMLACLVHFWAMQPCWSNPQSTGQLMKGKKKVGLESDHKNNLTTWQEGCMKCVPQIRLQFGWVLSPMLISWSQVPLHSSTWLSWTWSSSEWASTLIPQESQMLWGFQWKQDHPKKEPKKDDYVMHGCETSKLCSQCKNWSSRFSCLCFISLCLKANGLSTTTMSILATMMLLLPWKLNLSKSEAMYAKTVHVSSKDDILFVAFLAPENKRGEEQCKATK